MLRAMQLHWVARAATTLALMTVVTSLSSASFASSPKEKGGWKFANQMKKMAEKLELTPEQKEKIRGIMQKHEQATAEDRAAVKMIRKEMRGLWRAEPPPSRQQITEVNTKLRSRTVPLSDARIDTRLAVLNVLTKEQRAKLHEVRKDRRASRKERRMRRKERRQEN